MDNDLKEALETIKDLRAALHLAFDEDLSIQDFQREMADSEALLRKHGETDDIMDTPEGNGE
jgi:hypothetical protein